MGRKPNNYNQILNIFQKLHNLYPSYNIGRHIATSLEGYPDIWGLSDKEILYALKKYKAQLELDVPRETDDRELQKIIKDGMNLSLDSLTEEEDY